MGYLLAEVTKQQQAAWRLGFFWLGIPLLVRLWRFLRLNWSLVRTGMFRAYWFDS